MGILDGIFGKQGGSNTEINLKSALKNSEQNKEPVKTDGEKLEGMVLQLNNLQDELRKKSGLANLHHFPECLRLERLIKALEKEIEILRIKMQSALFTVDSIDATNSGAPSQPVLGQKKEGI
jgi:hypothetical protein